VPPPHHGEVVVAKNRENVMVLEET